MKNKILSYSFALSPIFFFIVFKLIMPEGSKFVEVSIPSFLVPALTYWGLHLGGVSEEMTGRSFRNKEGVEFKEYKKNYGPDIEMNSERKLIMFILILAGIFNLLVLMLLY